MKKRETEWGERKRDRETEKEKNRENDKEKERERKRERNTERNRESKINKVGRVKGRDKEKEIKGGVIERERKKKSEE